MSEITRNDTTMENGNITKITKPQNNIVKKTLKVKNKGDVFYGFIDAIKAGDPYATHIRNYFVTGASNTAACNLKKLHDALYQDASMRDYPASLTIGSAFGYYCQYIISQLYENVVCEEPVMFTFTAKNGEKKLVASAIDVFIRNTENPEDSIVVDIKTTNKTIDNWLKDLNNSGYVNQVNWYMGVKKCKLAYIFVFSISKPFNSLEESMEIVEVKFDPVMFKNDYEKYIDYFDAFDECRLPKLIKNFAQSKNDCAYCNAIYVCPRFERFAENVLIPRGFVKANHKDNEQYVLNSLTYRYPSLFNRRATKTVEYDFDKNAYYFNAMNQKAEFAQRLKNCREVFNNE